MLNTCDAHDDCVVVYDTKYCPVCKIVDNEDHLQERVNELEDEVKTLEKGE